MFPASRAPGWQSLASLSRIATRPATTRAASLPYSPLTRNRQPLACPTKAAYPQSLPSQQKAAFSTSRTLSARKKNAIKKDPRITNIRYHLYHPITPRPLRFSRLRSLRHWTIHRAWQLYQKKLRDAQQLELERMYNSMRAACEALRLTGEHGLSISEPGNAQPPVGARDRKSVEVEVETTGGDGKKATEQVHIDVAAASQRQTQVGRLYRLAMEKKGVWQGVPIEYARFQTDTPSKAGWDHSWKRS